MEVIGYILVGILFGWFWTLCYYWHYVPKSEKDTYVWLYEEEQRFLETWREKYWDLYHNGRKDA